MTGLIEVDRLNNTILTITIIIGSLFVPTVLAKIIPLIDNSQLIIGSVVNISLISTAIYLIGNFIFIYLFKKLFVAKEKIIY